MFGGMEIALIAAISIAANMLKGRFMSA